MAATISFFRVDNGDMTLLTLQSGKRVLIDCNIRNAADDSDDDTADVGTQLRDRLPKDSSGRRYVDVMVLSHPDADHCRGLKKHFHLGPIADYPKTSDKIVIRQMWSSPIVFRRASEDHVLCDDAAAWAAEARRRVRLYREKGYAPEHERILILGEDIDGKTDDLGPILIKVDEVTTSIDGAYEWQFEARLIAPIPADDEDEEELLSKNDSSAVLRFKLGSGTASDACRFLTGGDAGVAVWERIWWRNKDASDHLNYDLLLSPHHCSWRSLSYDSWSDLGEDAAVNDDAHDALAQTRKGAKIIASSKAVSDDDADPPCVRAKREYKAIVKGAGGEFVCVGDDGPEPLEYVIESGGLKPKGKKSEKAAPTVLVGREPQGHG